MAICILGIFFNKVIAQAILALFLHSLWMGVVMTLLAGVVIVVTRKASSRLRYTLLTGLMMVFLLCTGFVFYNSITVDTDGGDHAKAITHEATALEVITVPQQEDIVTSVLTFFKAHANLLVALWFAV